MNFVYEMYTVHGIEGPVLLQLLNSLFHHLAVKLLTIFRDNRYRLLRL